MDELKTYDSTSRTFTAFKQAVVCNVCAIFRSTPADMLVVAYLPGVWDTEPICNLHGYCNPLGCPEGNTPARRTRRWSFSRQDAHSCPVYLTKQGYVLELLYYCCTCVYVYHMWVFIREVDQSQQISRMLLLFVGCLALRPYQYITARTVLIHCL